MTNFISRFKVRSTGQNAYFQLYDAVEIATGYSYILQVFKAEQFHSLANRRYMLNALAALLEGGIPLSHIPVSYHSTEQSFCILYKPLGALPAELYLNLDNAPLTTPYAVYVTSIAANAMRTLYAKGFTEFTEYSELIYDSVIGEALNPLIELPLDHYGEYRQFLHSLMDSDEPTNGVDDSFGNVIDHLDLTRPEPADLRNLHYDNFTKGVLTGSVFHAYVLAHKLYYFLTNTDLIEVHKTYMSFRKYKTRDYDPLEKFREKYNDQIEEFSSRDIPSFLHPEVVREEPVDVAVIEFLRSFLDTAHPQFGKKDLNNFADELNTLLNEYLAPIPDFTGLVSAPELPVQDDDEEIPDSGSVDAPKFEENGDTNKVRFNSLIGAQLEPEIAIKLLHDLEEIVMDVKHSRDGAMEMIITRLFAKYSGTGEWDVDPFENFANRINRRENRIRDEFSFDLFDEMSIEFLECALRRFKRDYANTVLRIQNHYGLHCGDKI